MIGLLIVDDHRLVRAGLERLVRAFPEIDVVGCAADAREAFALCRERRPDVVLLGAEHRRAAGADAVDGIAECCPGTGVVVLSEAVGAGSGARAALVRSLSNDAPPSELREAIATTASIARSRRRGAPSVPRAGSVAAAGEAALSEREREVLALVSMGHQNKQIGRRLGISEKTVKAHLTRIFRRLGVTSRTQAALWAQRQAVELLPPAGGRRPRTGPSPDR